jgi:hypothetical protein
MTLPIFKFEVHVEICRKFRLDISAIYRHILAR